MNICQENKYPTWRISLLVLIIASFLLTKPLLAADEQKGPIPLPSGLSKDTQFVIYYVDKRFSELQREMDQRFLEMQREMNQRFSELQREMDKRFEQVDKRFEQVDKRFEQVDKRFEQVDKRFEQMMNFLWILAAIFTTLTGIVIGFAYWDRRTIIRQAREEAIEKIEKEGRLQDFIRALRAFARKNQEFAEILKSFNLL